MIRTHITGEPAMIDLVLRFDRSRNDNSLERR